MRLIPAALFACIATTAAADLTVTFRDGTPKDLFVISNPAACATGPFALTFDLYPSPAGLIFDVTGDGAGVKVFQPFEVTAGADFINAVSPVADGDQILTLDLADLPSGAEVRFTIDLDDTAGAREITVSGSEIAGALALVTTDVGLTEDAFDDTGTATVAMDACQS